MCGGEGVGGQSVSGGVWDVVLFFKWDVGEVSEGVFMIGVVPQVEVRGNYSLLCHSY